MGEKFIPYGRQSIDASDIAAVVDVLEGDWLTTGPKVQEFESVFARFVGSGHAIAVSNGTAGLHLCMLAADIGPGDEVIVPALTFAASANCVRYAGGTVVFADVLSSTLTIDPRHVESLITPRTKAIVAVDYAGLPADLSELLEIARRHGLLLIEDACHAPGAEFNGKKVGSIAHMTVFSFHPVKHMTTGEGGMITTNDAGTASRLRRLRNHGIDTDHRQRELQGTWEYDMVELGFNYRLTDIQCALGTRQLEKLPASLARRSAIAEQYSVKLGDTILQLPEVPEGRRHAWHLYPVRINSGAPAKDRATVFAGMRKAGIGVNVHYAPVYLHSYYRGLGYAAGLCPVSEDAYQRLLSLPMWYGLEDSDQQRVVRVLLEIVNNLA